MWNNVENNSQARFNNVNIYGQVDPTTGKTCYTHRTDTNASKYNFKVLAENDCNSVTSDIC